MIKKPLNIILSALFLTGFTGQEKYVQLDSSLNGRQSGQFVGRSNIQTVLAKGTQGEITGYRKFYSGNYGIKMKILSGPQAGSTLWVYYNKQNPALKLFKEKPQNWNKAAPSLTTSEVRISRYAQAQRNVAAQPQEIMESSAAASPQALAEKAVARLAVVQSEVAKAQTPACDRDCLAKMPTLQKPFLSAARIDLAPACSNLMDQNGDLGNSGKILFQTMNKPENKRHFTHDNSLGKLCPRFSHLSDEDKLQAWTWLWTALAQEESSCNATVIHPTVIKNKKTGQKRILNPYAGYGLWALEKDKNIRAWRGSECSNIGTIEGQIKCSVSIMRKQIASRGTADIRSGSYWGPLHRAESQMLPHMRRLSLCF